MAVGPPAGGGSVEFVCGVEEVVRDRAVGMEEGRGAFPFAVEEGVGGAGFTVVAEERLGTGHFTGGHAGFGLQFAFRGVELPFAFREAAADGAFGGFLTLFVQVEAAAVASVGPADFAAGD